MRLDGFGLQFMEVGVCEPLRPFNFYSLEEFQYQQLISRSRFFVGNFVNRQTKLNYVIKEVPYSEKALTIIRRIEKIRHISITPLLGLSLHRTKTGWNDGQRMRSEAPGSATTNNPPTPTPTSLNPTPTSSSSKQHVSLLQFMQKYEMNLHGYVIERRKKNQPFNRQQINSFLGQMLSVLERLQRENLAHRDIKPQNILYNKGSYLLCDFDDVMEMEGRERKVAELTTVQYSSPQFLKNYRVPKQKYFDPFKLDVYSLGLTLLYMCSMGRFSLQERARYIYESSEHSHADFIKQERRKWIGKSSEFKSFNAMAKMMLEQDEYKRDDFVTLSIKNKSKGDYDRANSDYNRSDDKTANTKTSAQNKRARKVMRVKREMELRSKQQWVYGWLSVGMLLLFVLLCLV